MWLIFAVFASMLWGLVYVLDEQIYKHISVATSLAIASIFAFVAMIILALVQGVLISDLKTIAGSKQVLLLTIVVTVVFVAAELCIGLSISGKNATLAALVEISYPLFTVIFGYLLFKEAPPSYPTFIGALFIAAGVSIITFANR